jgi:hypothetical protein
MNSAERNPPPVVHKDLTKRLVPQRSALGARGVANAQFTYPHVIISFETEALVTVVRERGMKFERKVEVVIVVLVLMIDCLSVLPSPVINREKIVVFEAIQAAGAVPLKSQRYMYPTIIFCENQDKNIEV